MVTTANNEISTLLFDDQAGDPATPAAGFSRVYTKSDGLYVIDDAGTVTGPFAETTGPGGGVTDYDIVRYTGGDISVTSTSVGNALPTLNTATVAAAAGDLCVVSISTRCTDTDADSIRIDVGTIVSAAVVNYLSSLSGTANSLGVSGWFVRASSADHVSGSVTYVVQSGDISAGSVEFGVRAWLSGANSRPLAASSGSGPFIFTVVNIGQP